MVLGTGVMDDGMGTAVIVIRIVVFFFFNHFTPAT